MPNASLPDPIFAAIAAASDGAAVYRLHQTSGTVWTDEHAAAAMARMIALSVTPQEVVNEAQWKELVRRKANEINIFAAARALADADNRPDPATLTAEYLDAAQLANLPKPEPLIEGIVTRHAYGILRGRDGTFKTFVALDWALCLATGKPWQGRHAERVPVLYVAGEGAYGLHDRIEAWKYAWQRELEPRYFTVRKSAVNLYRGGPPLDDLIERVQAGRHGFVVLDTLRRASGGADGNGSDMGVVVDNIDRIKQATDGGTVLALTHTDKGDNDTRGFSGIEDDADIVWHAKRGDSATFSIENTKMKDGPDGKIIDLAARPSLSSLIVQSAEKRPDRDTMTESVAKVLTAMRDTFALTGASVPDLIAKTGLSRASVYDSRAALLKAGRIRSTGNQRLELVQPESSPEQSRPSPDGQSSQQYGALDSEGQQERESPASPEQSRDCPSASPESPTTLRSRTGLDSGLDDESNAA